MIAHGVMIEQMVELVNAGLATATASAWAPVARGSRSRGCGIMEGGRRVPSMSR